MLSSSVAHRKQIMPINGQRLREMRVQRGLTQRELAERCEIGPKQIWRAEKGKGDPSSDHLARISKALSVSADYLLGLTDEPHHYLTAADLSKDEGELVTSFRSGDLKTGLDLFADKLSAEIQPKIIIPRRKP